MLPFNYVKFFEALAALISPASSVDGVQALRRITAIEDYDLKTLTVACLDHGVFDWLLRSLEYCGDADEPERTKETLWIFTNLAVTSEGCTVLLERGVAEKLCCVLHLGQPDDIVENALWALGNIAGEGRAAVESLIERGVFAHVCRYMTEVYQASGQVKVAVHKILAWTMSNFLRVKPPLPYNMTAPVLPLLAYALRSFAPFPGLEEVVVDTLWSLSYVFREESEGVRFEDLVGGGETSVLYSVLEQLHTSRMTRTPALRVLGNVAALDRGIPAQVFTAPVLGHLQRLAAGLGYNDTNAFKELLWTLSNVLSEGPEVTQRVLEVNLLQTLVPRVPVPTRDRSTATRLWQIASELSYVLRSALAEDNTGEGGAAVVALALLDAGAMRYCAQTLAVAAQLTEVSSHQTLGRIFKAVRVMIECGDTAPDPAVVTEGSAPRNEFLAAFFAAHGQDALGKLLENESLNSVDAAYEEAMALNNLLGDIVGDVAATYSSEPSSENEDSDEDSDAYASEDTDDGAEDDAGGDATEGSDDDVDDDDSDESD